MNLVLFGDGLWAARSLQRLLDEQHRAQAIVVRRRPSDGALADHAKRLKIPVYAPDAVNEPEFVELVRSLAPDLNISISYDQILRQPLIESAPLGFINCHAGKLPHYRGRNVVNWAIINNEIEIGLTVHYVDEGIDTGDIILQRALPITWSDTYATVLASVQEAFPDLLSEAIRLIERDEVKRRPQAHLEGTYYCRRLPGDEWIDWNDTSLRIYNKVRGITHPGPGARTTLGSRTVIIWRARYDLNWPKYIATPGEVVGLVPGQGVNVKTGDSKLTLESIQFEGESDEIVPSFGIGTRFGVIDFQTVCHLQSKGT